MKRKLFARYILIFTMSLFMLCSTACGNIDNATNATSDCYGGFSSFETTSETRPISETHKFLGTLIIEDIKLKVDVYQADISGKGEDAQIVTDAYNSAAYFSYGKQHIIADHDYQGFIKLLDVEIGTEAQLKINDNAIEIYKCVKTCNGYNQEALYDEDHVDVADYDEEYLIMYTCNGLSEDLYITFWQIMTQG